MQANSDVRRLLKVDIKRWVRELASYVHPAGQVRLWAWVDGWVGVPDVLFRRRHADATVLLLPSSPRL